MKKAELAQAVADAVDLSKKQAMEVIDATLDTIVKVMGRGEDVVLTGFGTFKVYKRKERWGRNPATGEQIKIPAAIKPKFRPGKLLKEAVK